MKAALVRRYGPPTDVTVAELPDPVPPGRGDVLVRVRASSMNPLDTKLRAGALRPLLRLRFPAVLGFDFAGTIEALGPRVTGWTMGDRVYGRTHRRTGGTHAELATIRAGVLDRIPQRLSFEDAGGLPLTGMTAVQALERAKLAAGENLLVNGAAGGVGSMAIQVGRAMGAMVTGVCSSDAAELVRGLGARVLDYTRGELAGTAERFDVILDTVYNDLTPDLARLLAPRARYITTGFSFKFALRMEVTRFFSRRRLGFIVSRADGALMRRLSELLEAGLVRPVVDSTFPLQRIGSAHERLERGHVRGKVIVTIP